MIENSPGLFPANIKLPVINETLIRSKILAKGISLKEAENSTNFIIRLILQAINVSKFSRDYISFVLYHSQSSIQLLPSKNKHTHAAVSAQAYLDPDSRAIVFVNDAKFTEVLEAKSILHEFWHAFWFYLHGIKTNHLPECHTGKKPRDGYPFTPQDPVSIKTPRKLVADVYIELRSLIKNLEAMFAAKQPTFTDELTKKIVTAVREHGGYKPDKYDLPCPSEILSGMITEWRKDAQWYDDNGYIVRPAEIIHKNGVTKCFAYATCRDHKDPLCQAISWAAYALKKCSDYETNVMADNKSGSFSTGTKMTIARSFDNQLSTHAKLLKQTFHTGGYNIDSDMSAQSALDLIKELDMSTLQALHELKSGYVQFKYLTTECDAILRELEPTIHQLPSYQKLVKAYQNETLKWLEVCSNGTALENISLPTPSVKKTALVDSSSSYTPSYLAIGLSSLLLSFLITLIASSIQYISQNRRLAAHMEKLCAKLLHLSLLAFSFSDTTVQLILLTEIVLTLGEYIGLLSPTFTNDISNTLGQLGLFKLKPAEAFLSAAGASVGNIIGHYGATRIFHKNKPF